MRLISFLTNACFSFQSQFACFAVILIWLLYNNLMLPNWRLDNIELSTSALNALQDLSFVSPLPVQVAVIPLLLNSKDVAVEAVTGSGKTLAFTIPVLEILQNRKRSWYPDETGAIIISPTTELAMQIFEVLSKIASHYCDSSKKPLFTSMVLTGSGRASKSSAMSPDFERLQLEGANILVSTPGRLVQVIHEGATTSPNPILRAFRSLEILILDEADRLLEMGFETQLNMILSVLPKQRRTGLFSATQTTLVEDLLRAGLRNPVRVVVRDQLAKESKKPRLNALTQRTPITLENYFMVTQSDDKLPSLLRLIVSHPTDKLLIFFPTCACVDYFSRVIRWILPHAQAKRILSLHRKARKKRAVAFSAFRNNPSSVLLCTDIMARGIDIPDVRWVIQCEPPTSANAFIHRCGRTARCGAQGKALLLLTQKELAYVDFLRINQKVSLRELDASSFDQLCIPESRIYTSDMVTSRARLCCKKDRLIYEKSLRAFVSYVQFYRKHECHLLLDYQELDFGRLANGFGLLRLPHMPELRNADVQQFKPCNVDVTKLKYREKSVAKQREVLQASKEPKKQINPKNKPWSKSKESRSKKHVNQAGRRKSAQPNPIGGATEPERELDEHELDELNDDYRLLKRIRKRKAVDPISDTDDER